MGMFDYLRCEYVLPNPEAQEFEFQTKDLECQMARYLITATGQLVEHATRTESVPEEERPYFGTDKWNDESEIYKLIGCVRSVPVGDIVIQHHGDIFFYETRGILEDDSIAPYLGGYDGNEEFGGWIVRNAAGERVKAKSVTTFEYQARFTNGRVEWIKRVEDDGNTT